MVGLNAGRAVVSLAALWMVASVSTAHAQGSDAAAQVKRGKMVWTNRACAGCHRIGTKGSGLNLAGLTQRRSRDWINRFMKETDQMLATDSTAMALMKAWGGVKMPKTNVSDQDIDAILAYIQSEEPKVKPQRP